ncbi:hypothetical protein GCM10008938_47590 [Deinococcus roseus]|uniref:Uncharacterized protein n=1 Tax=Deinococcus roseus TaxID=392414 RepID=A0ABQ2DFY6_9DEIO|nr:hypothetical protein GCM10008938_47590 [Deinococcus roseus]
MGGGHEKVVEVLFASQDAGLLGVPAGLTCAGCGVSPAVLTGACSPVKRFFDPFGLNFMELAEVLYSIRGANGVSPWGRLTWTA